MFLFSFISNPGKARRQQQPEEYDDDMFQERMCDALAEFAEPYNPLPSQLAQFPRGFGQGRPFFAYVPSGSDRNLEGVLKAHCRELDIRCCTFTLIYTKRGRIVDETGQGGNVADGAGSEDLWCEVEPNPYGITYFHLGFDDLLGTCYEDWVVDPVNAFKESASLERIVKPSSRGRRSLVETRKATAFIFWPRSRHSEVIIQTRAYTSILTTLKSSSSPPSSQHISIFEDLLPTLRIVAPDSAEARDIVPTLSVIAVHWRRADLWGKLTQCKVVQIDWTLLGEKNVSRAKRIFGY